MYHQLGQLDEIDSKIITLLSQNSRISFVEIGKQVGLSRVAVKMRVQSMEERGIIEKYSIILNPEKMGNPLSVFLDICIEPKYLNEVCDRLVSLPQLIKIYQMTGDTRLHIHAMLKSAEELEVFLKEEIYTLPGLKNVECNTIVTRIKDNEEIRI